MSKELGLWIVAIAFAVATAGAIGYETSRELLPPWLAADHLWCQPTLPHGWSMFWLLIAAMGLGSVLTIGVRMPVRAAR